MPQLLLAIFLLAFSGMDAEDPKKNATADTTEEVVILEDVDVVSTQEIVIDENLDEDFYSDLDEEND